MTEQIQSVASKASATTPSHFYKYRPIDGFSESWILNNEVFFAPSKLFNDPFDCKARFRGPPSESALKAFLLRNPRLQQASPSEREQLVNKRIAAPGFVDLCRRAGVSTYQSLASEYGVLSLSSKRNSILMFAHYGHSHAGYCLEYRNGQDRLFSWVRQVQYEEEYPRVDVFEDPDAAVTTGMRTKAKCWDYESEWRVFMKPPGVYQCPEHLLTGIIFGCNIVAEERERLIAMNSKRKLPAKLYQTTPKPDQFGLDIQSLA
jgi:hypothetical protein